MAAYTVRSCPAKGCVREWTVFDLVVAALSAAAFPAAVVDLSTAAFLHL